MNKINKIYNLYLKHSICTDSRNVKEGQIFLALKGENFDGNKFAHNAIKKGCSYAIVDDSDVYLDDRYIYVNNTLETLQKLSNFHRKKLGIPIFAITGTNGKTTTKELIANILSHKFNLQATKGNFNNNIGVPLTLLTFNKNIEFGIIEMGANHRGEIEELCEIAAPNYGLITNVGSAHLEGFGKFETIKETKAELYHYLVKKNERIFINKNNEHLLSMLPENSKAIYYGLDMFKSFSYQQNPFLEISYKDFNNKDVRIKTKLIGNYNIENIISAISVGKYFKISNENIKKAIENFKPVDLRSQLKKTKHNSLVIDAYNANPVSMKAAINSFGTMGKKKKIVIIGDMLELGKYSKEEHLKIINFLKKLNFDHVVFVGKNFYSVRQKDNYTYLQTTDDLVSILQKKAIRDHWILLKASRGIQLEKIIQYL